MPRLRVTVTAGEKQQGFELDGNEISIGRAPGSTLVLPMSWVGAKHVVMTEEGGDVRVRPGEGGRVVLYEGSPVPDAGVLLPGGWPFVIEIPGGPNGGGVRLEAWPGGAGGGAQVGPSRVAGSAGAGGTNNGQAARGQGGGRVETRASAASTGSGELAGAGGVLLGALVLAGVLLLSRGDEAGARQALGTNTAGAVPTIQPAVSGDREKLLEEAAGAYSGGDFARARETLERASAAGATGVVADALGTAIKREEQRQKGTAPATTRTVAGLDGMMDLDKLVEFEGEFVTPEKREAILKQRADAEAAAKKAANEKKRQEEEAARAKAQAAAQGRDEETRKVITQAEADAKAGKNAKTTDTGKRALAFARDQVKKKLGPGSDLRFPDSADDRVVVVFAEGTYQVRGYVDQWNQGQAPLRMPYLAKLKPSGADGFEVVSVDFLQ